MTYKEKYDQSDTWQKKVIVMNLFHQMKSCNGNWSLRRTATYFDVSIGLVSENVAMGNNFDKIKHFEFRQQAIDFLRR